MRKILVATTLATMLAPLNSTMIVVALPDILRERHSSLAWGSWLVISYLITMAAMQPVGGSLGDRYGHLHMLRLGLIGFIAATGVAIFSPHISVLLVARTAQAAAGAAAIPNAAALVRSAVPAERRGRAFGLIGSAVAVAAALGPPLGGIVTAALGWRWIFALNLLLVLPALLIACRFHAPRQPAHRARFDLRGTALLIGALSGLALSLTIWRVEGVTPLAAPLLAGLGLACGAALLRHARRHGAAAVLDIGIFQRPGFAPAALGMAFGNLAMYTVLLALPVFLSSRAGWSGAATGLLLAGLSVQMAVCAPLGGWLADRHGPRLPALAGALLIAAGLLPLLSISPDWPWFAYLATLVPIGAGSGLSATALQAVAIEAVAPEQTSQAAGLFSTLRYLGSISGATAMAALLAGADPSLASFRLLFAVLTLAAVCAALAGHALPQRRRAVALSTSP